jgi:LacI family transcriptional regulator
MTLIEVAKLAKVSTATVSRVLNKTGAVKKSTRARVLKAVQELKYHPNIHAQRLAGTSRRTLGMIASNLENPFFLDIFRTLESDAHHHGYEIIVANTDYQPSQLQSSIRLMIGHRLAGLAVIVSEMDASITRQLAECDMPIVFYDGMTSGHHITNIKVNYQKGIQKVVEYLHNLGHRRMSFIGHHHGLVPLLDRKKAFLDTIKGYPGEVEFSVIADRDGPTGGRQATRQLLASGFKPTAIICVNDFMAIGVLRELHSQKLSVPRDVSVTGYDNISLSDFVCPSLTTLNIPREKIGHLVFEALVPKNESSSIRGLELQIEPELIIRESTEPAKKG